MGREQRITDKDFGGSRKEWKAVCREKVSCGLEPFL